MKFEAESWADQMEAEENGPVAEHIKLKVNFYADVGDNGRSPRYTKHMAIAIAFGKSKLCNTTEMANSERLRPRFKM